jgi:hypothetical protein
MCRAVPRTCNVSAFSQSSTLMVLIPGHLAMVSNLRIPPFFTRHANFPTTDIPVEELPAAKAWFSRAIEERVFPFMASCYPDLIQGIEAL